MSTTLVPTQPKTNFQDLHPNEVDSVLEFLNLQSLESFEAVSLQSLTDVFRYKMHSIHPDKIKNFIYTLRAGLDPKKYREERKMLEKIQVKIKVKATFPKNVYILKLNTIKKSILEALTSLDISTIQSLKFIAAPRFFEEIFEILEIYRNVLGHPYLDSYLFALDTNKKVDIIFEAMELLNPLKISMGPLFLDAKFGLLAIALSKAGNWNMAYKALNLISDNQRSYALEGFAEELSKLEENKALEVTNLISDERTRNEILSLTQRLSHNLSKEKE
ncbi:MAG: hypothetical protein PVI40_03620 [Chlamydiota bacterium]|jgi:hypothetical protein